MQEQNEHRFLLHPHTFTGRFDLSSLSKQVVSFLSKWQCTSWQDCVMEEAAHLMVARKQNEKEEGTRDPVSYSRAL